MKKQIPNLLTATNLFFGMVAMVFIFIDNLTGAMIAVLISLVMDFFDGFVARMLKVQGPIGKELDSLADMVTFGAVPGMVMARLIHESTGGLFPPEQITLSEGFPWFLLGFLITILSAFRLAKFNLDERQSDAFYGVPTPANTILIFSFWMITEWRPDFWLSNVLNNTWVLIGITAIASWLLVADIRLLALKFKNFSVADNLFRYILIGSTVILLAIFQHVGIPFIILLYLALSLVENMMKGSN
ncbi:MAG: CDP-alcohol phosphatidyltransferase family protein [Bacteroidetes bacterium]|nr:CDP-alcohol phosphatidyltransferase family protein [Bacteroidota bacterium]